MKNKSQNQIEYRISSTELTCINVLIKTIEVAINRRTFSETELQEQRAVKNKELSILEALTPVLALVVMLFYKIF